MSNSVPKGRILCALTSPELSFEEAWRWRHSKGPAGGRQPLLCVFGNSVKFFYKFLISFLRKDWSLLHVSRGSCQGEPLGCASSSARSSSSVSPRCPDHSAARSHGATWGHGGVDANLGALLAPSSRNATSEGRASKCTSFTWERHEHSAQLRGKAGGSMNGNEPRVSPTGFPDIFKLA